MTKIRPSARGLSGRGAAPLPAARAAAETAPAGPVVRRAAAQGGWDAGLDSQFSNNQEWGFNRFNHQESGFNRFNHQGLRFNSSASQFAPAAQGGWGAGLGRMGLSDGTKATGFPGRRAATAEAAPRGAPCRVSAGARRLAGSSSLPCGPSRGRCCSARRPWALRVAALSGGPGRFISMNPHQSHVHDSDAHLREMPNRRKAALAAGFGAAARARRGRGSRGADPSGRHQSAARSRRGNRGTTRANGRGTLQLSQRLHSCRCARSPASFGEGGVLPIGRGGREDGGGKGG